MPYEWIDHWAWIPDAPSGRENGRTHGVCVLMSGNVVVFHQADHALVTYDPAGRLVSAVGGSRWNGAHGLTRVVDGGREYLWLTDQNSAKVVKVTPNGDAVQAVARPDHPAYGGAEPQRYVPTWVTQNPVNGDIWVGDGYGASLVHRYDKNAKYLGSLDGTEGAGRFAEPHGLNVTVRGGAVELFITDRANHRIVVYDGDGKFLRSSLVAHSPCCFDFLHGQVLVPELFTGVKILDAASLALVTEVGKSDRVGPHPDGRWWPAVAPEGWPDLAGTEHVRPGFFNSPHGGCFAPNGDVYVVEWIVGGRITKLRRTS